MAIVINGSGTITGITAGGLPDASVVDADIAGMASSKLTGALPAIDGASLTGISTGVKGADIASAATVVVGTDGGYFDITGTTGISTQFTVAAGRTFTLQFDGAVVITDNAAITLAGAANFTTAAGDILTFTAVAANTVVQTGYSLVDGGSPITAASGVTTAIHMAYFNFGSTGTKTITGIGFQPTSCLFMSCGNSMNTACWCLIDDSTFYQSGLYSSNFIQFIKI